MGTIIEMGGSQGGSVMVDNAQILIANREILMGVGDGARGYAGGKAILSDTLITGQVGYALTLSDPNIDPHLARLQTTSNGLYATALTGGVISARTHTLHATSSEGIDGDSISESAVALTGQGRA